MENENETTYLGDVLKVLMALLVHSRLLQVPANPGVFTDEDFAMIRQPVQNLQRVAVLSQVNVM